MNALQTEWLSFAMAKLSSSPDYLNDWDNAATTIIDDPMVPLVFAAGFRSWDEMEPEWTYMMPVVSDWRHLRRARASSSANWLKWEVDPYAPVCTVEEWQPFGRSLIDLSKGVVLVRYRIWAKETGRA